MSVVRKATKRAPKPEPEPEADVRIIPVPNSSYVVLDPRGNTLNYSRLGPALDMATELAEDLQEAIGVCNSYGTIVTITPKQRREIR